MRLSEEDKDVFGRKVESGSITSQKCLIVDLFKDSRKLPDAG
jgi:hypothetical protein